MYFLGFQPSNPRETVGAIQSRCPVLVDTFQHT